MKKKGLYLSIILFSVWTLSGCDDFLTVTPISDLTSDSFWKTESDANVGVVAIYNAFSKAMSPGMWNWGEARSDNFDYYEKDAPDQRELVENNILIDNSAALWTSLYNVIGKANAAIKYIPGIMMQPALKNHYLAEAYAMRAWAYFYCIRVWGDVPLYLEPVEEVSQGIYRTRMSKDYIIENVILPDLENAYYMIDKTNTTRTRMNAATVCLLLMDVYAWIHDYEMVIKIKEERVNKLDGTSEEKLSNTWVYLVYGGSDFIQNWRGMFIESTTGSVSPEVWFKLSYDQYGNGTNSAIGYFAKSSAKLTVSNTLKNAYATADLRRSAQWSGNRLTLKFWEDGTVFSGDGTIMSENDLVLYRYADVVLLYAEALNELGRTDEAITQLNKTHLRAGNAAFTAISFNSQSELADAILAERQKEFVGEGKRWFDLVRTGKWAEHSQLTDPVKVLFPIHRDHLNENPELTQNEGYPYP